METITLQITDAEKNALQQLLDLALRNNGMGAFPVVSHFVALLNQASQQAVAAQAQVKTSAAPATPAAPTIRRLRRLLLPRSHRRPRSLRRNRRRNP